MILRALALLIPLLLPRIASAHVKWFAENRFANPPVELASLNTLSFWFLLVLSVITLAIFVYADRWLERWPSYMRLNRYLESYSDRSVLILRIFAGASLLLSWQADSMIAPELRIPGPGVGWYQFFLALGLLTRYTTPVSGTGMMALYFYSMSQYGFFHMLDYVIYPAIGYYLLVSSIGKPQILNTRIPALYIGLGFSLCWAALEKIFFPDWGLEVLAQQPALTMGLPHEFFLMACAFVELCLGYLLIIGLLQRPLALTITLVFFTTSAFFGKTEVIGHTILHGALLVFIVVGPGGYYPPPITFHKRLGLRAAFAAVNFLIVGALLALPYHALSKRAYEKQAVHQH